MRCSVLAIVAAIAIARLDAAQCFSATSLPLQRIRPVAATACPARGQQARHWPRMADSPAYTAHSCAVVRNEELAPGSRLIRVQADDKSVVGGYLPGHVLALELLEDPGGAAESSNEGKHGDGMKGPYTVSRADWDAGTIDVVFRVVRGGRLSQRLARAGRGTRMSLGGRFKVPIEEGVAPEAELVVGVSTGVGLGPLLGFAERELARGGRTVALFAGFRNPEEILFEDEIEDLREAPPPTSPTPCPPRAHPCHAAGAGVSGAPRLLPVRVVHGRRALPAAARLRGPPRPRHPRAPPSLERAGALPPGSSAIQFPVGSAARRGAHAAARRQAVASAHFHLVGNGAMVNALKCPPPPPATCPVSTGGGRGLSSKYEGRDEACPLSTRGKGGGCPPCLPFLLPARPPALSRSLGLTPPARPCAGRGSERPALPRRA